jgi:Kef-type K+ transport system membrane component KefB/Trk K+ transport system NAD-binding subunit
VVVGEILAGIVIGRSGFNLVQENPTLEVLSALGFAFLMFLSGLEIDFSMLTTSGRRGSNPVGNPALLGTVLFVLTVVIALLIAIGFTQIGLVESPWLLGLILSTTSLGIVLPVLRERGLSGGFYGQTILLAALIADFATMVLITVVVAVLSGGITLEVLLVGVLILVFLLATRFSRRLLSWGPMRRALDDLAHATIQIKVRGALAVMFGFVVLSEMLGAEVILGAFLAGALIAVVTGHDDIEARSKLDAIGFGFIVPIFFIMVGVRFDLPALLSSTTALILFPLLLIAAYAVKLLPALSLNRVFSRRQSLSAGLLISSRLSLIIAASAIGMQLGIVSEALNADIILVAIVTSTVSPALFNRLLPATTDGVIGQRPLIIAGAGRAGMMLAQRLRQHGDPLVVLDNDERTVERMQRTGFQAMHGDAATADGLVAAGIEGARGLVVASSNDDYNLQVCRMARSIFGLDHIVAYVQDATRLREFEEAGAKTVNPVLASASVMDSLVRFPDTYTLLTELGDDMDVVEIEILNPSCTGRALMEMRLPGDVLVLSVRRNGELFVPHGHNRLQHGDHVTLLGHLDSVQEAAEWLQQSGPF